MKYINIIVVAMLSMALAACGGSDGGSDGGSASGFTGSTSAATISAENEQDIAVASTVASKQAVNNSEAQGDIPIAAKSNQSALFAANDLVASTLQLLRIPTGVDVSEDVCTDGGSASYEGDESNATVTYNNCSFDGVTANGTAVITTTADSYRIEYKNFSITSNGETQTLNATISCDSNFNNCTIRSDFEENGRSYRMENSSVSGDDSSGYNVEARVYDEEHGYVDFSATGLVFDCPNGNPSTGSISITDGQSNTAEVTFDSCSGYTVTVDGVGTSYQW
ncbi:hypothetical protein [Bermanella sp. R86510]|uniref:hypothetical protein n=1 Tax=unclassified Bermanella TaxID=2627862 RepID=UPI0037CA98F7